MALERVAVTTINVHEAKTQLSRLLTRVEAGEEVIIARDGKPIARLAPLRARRPRRCFGALRGRVAVDDSFFEPLPEDELAGFE
jgi:prevent-host-death family protein